MKHFFASNKIQSAMLVCCLLLLSSCATTPSPGETIEARAMARWEALLSGDLATAYEYLSPAYRTSVSSLQYQRSLLLQKVQWTGATYLEEACEETVCNVSILLDFAVYGALPGVKSFKDTERIVESWILVDGNWYYVPEQ